MASGRPRRCLSFYFGRHRRRRAALFIAASLSLIVVTAAVLWAGPTLKSAEGWHFGAGGFLDDYLLRKEGDAWHVVDYRSLTHGDIYEQWEVRIAADPVFVALPESTMINVGSRLPIALKRTATMKVMPPGDAAGALVPLEQLPPTGIASVIASIEKEASADSSDGNNLRMVVRTLRAKDHTSYEPWAPGIRWVASAYIVAHWLWSLPLVMGLVGLLLLSACRSFAAFRRGACVCGYDLKGIASPGRCPECGAVA